MKIDIEVCQSVTHVMSVVCQSTICRVTNPAKWVYIQCAHRVRRGDHLLVSFTNDIIINPERDVIMNMTTTRYTRLVGPILMLLAIVGLTQTTSTSTVASVLSIDVNLINIVVLLIGGLSATIAGYLGALSTRTSALLIGVVFVAIGVLGLISGPGTAAFGIAVSTVGSVFHMVVGMLGLLAWRSGDEIAREAA